MCTAVCVRVGRRRRSTLLTLSRVRPRTNPSKRDVPEQRLMPPPEERADYVVHSATKALGGHSDLTAGVVLGRAELMGPVLHRRKVAGAILDPAAAWTSLNSPTMVATAKAALA